MAERLGVAATHFLVPFQIHSAEAIAVSAPLARTAALRRAGDGDAGLALGVTGADCGMLLFADARRRRRRLPCGLERRVDGVIAATVARWKSSARGAPTSACRAGADDPPARATRSGRNSSRDSLAQADHARYFAPSPRVGHAHVRPAGPSSRMRVDEAGRGGFEDLAARHLFRRGALLFVSPHDASQGAGLRRLGAVAATAGRTTCSTGICAEPRHCRRFSAFIARVATKVIRALIVADVVGCALAAKAVRVEQIEHFALAIGRQSEFAAQAAVIGEERARQTEAGGDRKPPRAAKDSRAAHIVERAQIGRDNVADDKPCRPASSLSRQRSSSGAFLARHILQHRDARRRCRGFPAAARPARSRRARGFRGSSAKRRATDARTFGAVSNNRARAHRCATMRALESASPQP
jgi:hypothetical protein